MNWFEYEGRLCVAILLLYSFIGVSAGGVCATARDQCTAGEARHAQAALNRIWSSTTVMAKAAMFDVVLARMLELYPPTAHIMAAYTPTRGLQPDDAHRKNVYKVKFLEWLHIGLTMAHDADLLRAHTEYIVRRDISFGITDRGFHEALLRAQVEVYSLLDCEMEPVVLTNCMGLVQNMYREVVAYLDIHALCALYVLDPMSASSLRQIGAIHMTQRAAGGDVRATFDVSADTIRLEGARVSLFKGNMCMVTKDPIMSTTFSKNNVGEWTVQIPRENLDLVNFPNRDINSYLMLTVIEAGGAGAVRTSCCLIEDAWHRTDQQTAA